MLAMPWVDRGLVDSDKFRRHNRSPNNMPRNHVPFENRHYNDLIPLPTQEIILMMGFLKRQNILYIESYSRYVPKLHGDDLLNTCQKKEIYYTRIGRKQSVWMRRIQ